MMDEGVGEEVMPLDASEGGHLHSKDGEYSVKTESGSMMESQELVIPGDTDYSESIPHVLANILEGKNVNRSLGAENPLEQAVANARFMDDDGGMVEELTVRNYDNLNLSVVGTSDSCDRSRTRMNQWLQYYNTGGLLATGSSHGCSLNREDRRAGSGVWDSMGCASASELLPRKPLKEDQNEVEKPMMMSENGGSSGNVIARGGFRTKMLSKSGFSEFFVKSTLKGKGVICRGPPVESLHVDGKNQNEVKFVNAPNLTSDASPNPLPKAPVPASNVVAGFRVVGPDSDGVNLREWLSNVYREVNKVERLQIFKQIVELVENSHSQGVALHDLRPSFFILLPSNRVKYAGFPQRREKQEILTDKSSHEASNLIATKRISDHETSSKFGAKKMKFNEDRSYRQLPAFASWHGAKIELSGSDINITDSQHVSHEQHQSTGYWSPKSSIPGTISAPEQQLTVISKQLEEKWYSSPEEHCEEGSKFSKDIYGLGVLLFELLGHFDSERARNAAMMDMRHRILPPKFLSENPKEAGFCLWLLHPDPSSRPSAREILESEVLSGLKETSASVHELSSSIEQEDMESELLLHFLVTIKEQKQKHAYKLVENIKCLEADVEEIGRRRGAKSLVADSTLLVDSVDLRANKCHHNDFLISDLVTPASNMKESRWVENMAHLETAYFSMRSRIQLGENDPVRRSDNELLRVRENYYPALTDEVHLNSADRVGGFFDGLCKYARYSKFKVRGVLRNGEFNNSANVICSLSFDRDDEYFAAAGVSKKIKIFEFNALLNHTVDIHYPVVEMLNRSKLSSVCWNNYIRNYLASTDYDGVVKLWDASTGQGFSEFSEHEKRAWSVDFSPLCPTKLASGSDDCSVKIWSLNEKNCLRTIRNIANVCCVQFSSHSSHFLAFGSADYKTYCYDLRNARSPWCILAGHEKAVSYIKFLDSETLITASTDNTLKVWDLNKTSHGGLSTGACSLTLRGHTNEKNFVGLSVADGYITCGSETNEVFAYYRSLPMPINSCKFGSIDPISGKETDDDNGQFVSSVCWRGKSDMVIAANSSGCIKVLQMV